MGTTDADRALESFYRRYLQVCNEHQFERLGEFVDEDVTVNGEAQGLQAYVEGLQLVVAAFPDYRWDLKHLFADRDWVSAHFTDTGTHLGEFLGVPGTGRSISTQEFAVYRVDAGKIVEVWVAADNLHLLSQLR